ncbi:S-adenosyl-L-methionine-dependent methyltransferase [Pseudoneurospora amorphoporcata]|uniref:Arsenite methyltransferase n=1 Tax=Pseudoneurospora amorphoporcata TaxID=241081 RepID=A0AAN6NVW3_9PEZI|nr:S-adenosyl-L-methionine-dependent methyltransferase [Pseudoneurospora amorphoporcata]
MDTRDTSQIYEEVAKHYSAASQTTSVKYGETVAKSFGYTEEELANIPEGANLGLSCGNPLAITSLREGETVIDLGSGAGFDVFLAAHRVGPTGRSIGIDFNDDMLARANALKSSRGFPDSQVSFIKGSITSIPVESGIADCIISNCVINLVPEAEKPLVFKEMHRVLKSGGRVAVSDILAKKPLPEKLRNDIAMYVGCIAGASEKQQYENWLKDAGFEQVLIQDTGADINVYLDTDEEGNRGGCCAPPGTVKEAEKASSSCCKPAAPAASSSCCKPVEKKESSCCKPAAKPEAEVEKKEDLNEWVGSYKIYAVKN